MRLNPKQIAHCTGGSFAVQPIDASEILTSLTWDSREVQPGCLYVALPGERVDGHSFVASALVAGARAALTMQPLDEATLVLAREMGAAVIEVPNTTAAITDIAREWRSHLKGRIIAITGSSGKTTTKNLVRDVLSASYSVVATTGNQNNELGVPRTILAADPETQMVVVEMGMRGLGQIAELCSFVRPHWALITNIGESHIELLGSKENIARAKAEVLEALPMASGVAFLNGSDDMSDFAIEHAQLVHRLVSSVCFDGSGEYAPREGCLPVDWRRRPAVWAEDIRLDEQGRPCFTLCARGFSDEWPPNELDRVVERCSCTLGLRGLHNVHNACSAAAVGRQARMSLEEIAAALSKAMPESGRQEVLAARGGFTVVNDAYNANPDSMRASLATFCSMQVAGQRVAVLGDMGELGDYAQACHEGVGRAAAELPLDCLICVGELSRHIARAAEEAGMPSERIVLANSIAEVLGELDIRLHPGDAVLVKASHFMGLTRVVEGLVN